MTRVLDMATAQLRIDLAGARQLVEDRDDEIRALKAELAAVHALTNHNVTDGHMRRANVAASDAKKAQAIAAKAVAEAAGLRAERFDLQVEVGYLRPLHDAVHQWFVAGSASLDARASAMESLIDAMNAANDLAAAQRAYDANPDDDFDAADAAAPFGSPLTADRIMSEVDHLDSAGACPTRIQ